MIIVEGPDGAGKTTLIGHLEQEYGLTREPRAVSSDVKLLTPIGEYIERELYRGFGWRLYDRFALISSPQYMMTPDRTFQYPLTEVDWLQLQYLKLAKINPVLIFCMPPLEVVKANVARDPKNQVIADHIEEIYYHYVAYIGREFNPSAMIWDYTNPNRIKLGALIRWAQARVAKEENARPIEPDA